MIKGGKAGRGGSLVLGLWLLIFAISVGSAWGAAIFGPKEYERGHGAPRVATDSFTATAGMKAVLEVYNDDREDSEAEWVKDCTIYLNGQLVVGTDEFGKKVNFIRKTVTLQTDNVIQVELRGKPEGEIVVRIVPACGDVVFGPKEYVRQHGSPKWVRDTFTAAPGRDIAWRCPLPRMMRMTGSG